MEISLSIFYYIYLIFVIIYLFYTFSNIYHLVRFGFLSVSNITLIFFYLAVSILILTISWRYISQINWHQMISLIPQFQF
ncbi:MAG: hypothetical protein WC675_04050 [Patescibacteria group bacterium]